MKKIIYILSSFLICSLQAQNSLLFNPMTEQHIVVNNRVLAKVNGKAISVVDVLKKMDTLFYRQFPEYTSSAPARFQFYNVNWKHVLNDLIDQELILADAEEHKMPLSNGDVRQEMENHFGPNIIANLDKIGMSYTDAAKIIRSDILTRRMLYYRVNTRAQWEVTPQAVRAAYEEYARENILEKEWIYKVITVRDKNATKGKETAQQVYETLLNKTTDLANLASYFKEKDAFSKTTSVNVSEEMRHTEKEMSEIYRDTLTKMAVQQFEGPIPQKSRSDGSIVYRIFYLTDKTEGGVPLFGDIEHKLKDKLLGIALDKETSVYLKKMRNHFDVEDSTMVELTNEEFQPFMLQ